MIGQCRYERRSSTAASTHTPESAPRSPVDIAEIVRSARHIYPVELESGDLLFDTTGVLQPITEASRNNDGKVVSALLASGHRVWLRSHEPIIAVLPRTDVPTITIYERVCDAADEAGWADGNPRVIDSDADRLAWEPDDGNPVAWALGILDRHGTPKPSSPPPFTERTWYSGSGVDLARSGATVDTSAHLAEFTRAEAERIGARISSRRLRVHRLRRISQRSATLMTLPTPVPTQALFAVGSERRRVATSSFAFCRTPTIVEVRDEYR